MLKVEECVKRMFSPRDPQAAPASLRPPAGRHGGASAGAGPSGQAKTAVTEHEPQVDRVPVMASVPLVPPGGIGATQNGADAPRNHRYDGEALPDAGGAVPPPHQLGHEGQERGGGGGAHLPPQVPPDGQGGDQNVPDRQWPYSPAEAQKALSQHTSNFCVSTTSIEDE